MRQDVWNQHLQRAFDVNTVFGGIKNVVLGFSERF